MLRLLRTASVQVSRTSAWRGCGWRWPTPKQACIDLPPSPAVAPQSRWAGYWSRPDALRCEIPLGLRTPREIGKLRRKIATTSDWTMPGIA